MFSLTMKYFLYTCFLCTSAWNIVNTNQLNSGCGLSDANGSPKYFYFVESPVKVSERLIPGDLIPVSSFQAHNVAEIILKNEYANATLVNGAIILTVLKNFHDFIYSSTTSIMHIEYDLICMDGTKLSTFNDQLQEEILLEVIDENNEEPCFDSNEYNFKVIWEEYDIGSLNKNGYEVTSEANPIVIEDADYLPQNANIVLECEIMEQAGDECDSYIQYFLSELDQSRYGEARRSTSSHLFGLRIFLKNSIPQKINKLVANITASDGRHTVSTNVTVDFFERVSDGEEPANTSKTEKLPLFGIIGGVGAFMVVLTALLGYSWRRMKKQKKDLSKLTEADIKEFHDGTSGFPVGRDSIAMNVPILSRPYNSQFEIPRDHLRIDETTQLGSGVFGTVLKGYVVMNNNDVLDVAVKTVKKDAGVLYFKALLTELKIMAFIGKHSNIVSLIGACTQNIRKREIFIAVELCTNGNFRNYLKDKRDVFDNLVNEDGILLMRRNSLESMRSGSSGLTLRESRSIGHRAVSIDTIDLIKWSFQIASGMEYIHSKRVIHGDLAARNILLDDFLVCKIADFGLSKALVDYNYQNYTKKSQSPLPWKYMAIESLKDLKFSLKSDVWTFGVLLWEIFTLGQKPFAVLQYDDTFLTKLESGLRLDLPKFATKDIHEIMLDCWTAEPDQRPNFFDMKRMLGEILKKTCDYTDFNDQKSGYGLLISKERARRTSTQFSHFSTTPPQTPERPEDTFYY